MTILTTAQQAALLAALKNGGIIAPDELHHNTATALIERGLMTWHKRGYQLTLSGFEAANGVTGSHRSPAKRKL